MTELSEPQKRAVKSAAVCYCERSDGRILVVWNRRYNGWTLPGGLVEEGETPSGAARRELREETGLEVDRIEGQYVAQAMPTPDHPDRATLVYVFRVDWRGTPRECEIGCPVTSMTIEEFLAACPFAPFYRRMFGQVGMPKVAT